MIALKALREQDFGYYEGKPFHSRSRDSSQSGKEHHRSQHQGDPGFEDVESKESMTERMNEFLREHLIPILQDEGNAEDHAVAIVSHGIILSHLWRSILKILPTDAVSMSPGVSIGSGKVTPLEYLGGWSNTGYLELIVESKPSDASKRHPSPLESNSPLHNHRVIIKTVNGKEHLQGFKRTRGGVGSSKFDEGQKSIDSFFKKRKVATGQD